MCSKTSFKHEQLQISNSNFPKGHIAIKGKRWNFNSVSQLSQGSVYLSHYPSIL